MEIDPPVVHLTIDPCGLRNLVHVTRLHGKRGDTTRSLPYPPRILVVRGPRPHTVVEELIQCSATTIGFPLILSLHHGPQHTGHGNSAAVGSSANEMESLSSHLSAGTSRPRLGDHGEL
jgi:hypothetical protein